MTTKKTVHVICIKWGEYYQADYVNRLFNAVERNIHNYSLKFYCFTDNAKGLNDAILVKSLPELKDAQCCYLKEAGLCDDNLGGLNGERVLYFDLDSVITGDLDCFISFSEGDVPYITRDYGRDRDDVGGSNVYSWVVGTLGFIKTDYEKNAEEVVRKYGTASQEYLSHGIIEKYGSLNFYPNEWHVSFKKHCLRKWPMNLLKMPKRPRAVTRLVNFHGDPKIHDAQAGVWTTRNKVPLYKRAYKYTKPVKWLEEFWF